MHLDQPKTTVILRALTARVETARDFDEIKQLLGLYRWVHDQAIAAGMRWAFPSQHYRYLMAMALYLAQVDLFEPNNHSEVNPTPLGIAMELGLDREWVLVARRRNGPSATAAEKEVA
jgi:hypothetical protein